MPPLFYNPLKYSQKSNEMCSMQIAGTPMVKFLCLVLCLKTFIASRAPIEPPRKARSKSVDSLIRHSPLFRFPLVSAVKAEGEDIYKNKVNQYDHDALLSSSIVTFFPYHVIKLNEYVLQIKRAFICEGSLLLHLSLKKSSHLILSSCKSS